MFNSKMHSLGMNRSCIRELFEYGMRQAAAVGRENVFDFSIGNPSIPAPAEVNEAIGDIIDTVDSLQVHGYTSATGYSDVRAAVADDLTKRFDMEIKPENLFITCGAAPALISVIRALAIDAETEILAIAPHFPEYKPFVEAAGCRFAVVTADMEAFQINFSGLEAAISKNTQAIIVNSPNNPSGAVFSRETIDKLSGVLKKKAEEFGHPIYIISDEPYRELVYGDTRIPFIPRIYPDTIICYSYSKSLSLPGERIGYVCVPDCAADSADIYAAVAGAARITGHTCAPSLMQKVITRCAGVRPDLKAYDENRILLYSSLTEIGYECVKPEGAFYLFVKAPGGNAKAFSDKAKARNLLVVPSDDFGVPGYFRLSYCVSNDMIRRSIPIFKEIFFN